MHLTLCRGMFRLSLITISAVLLSASSLSAFDEPANVRRDTEFPVEVAHTVKAKSAKVGDTVEFRTAEAVLIGNDIVVPRSATILATITEVQRRSPDSRRSLIRIRIHTLRWKHGEAPLNAIVASVRSPQSRSADWLFRNIPTFLEGIRVISYQRHRAFTEFLSDKKEVTLRSGVTLMLRQIDPTAYPDREFDVYTPDSQRTAENW